MFQFFFIIIFFYTTHAYSRSLSLVSPRATEVAPNAEATRARPGTA